MRRKRLGGTGEDEPVSSGEGEAGAEAGAPEPMELRLDYYSDDALPREAMETLGIKVRQVMNSLRENPDPDANEFVRVVVLSQLVNMEKALRAQEFQTLVEQERKRVALTPQVEVNRAKVAQIEVAAHKGKAEIEHIKAEVKRLKQQIEVGRLNLERAGAVALSAGAALESGHSVDAMSVYNKICEIVGLTAPADQQRAAEQQGVGSSESGNSTTEPLNN